MQKITYFIISSLVLVQLWAAARAAAVGPQVVQERPTIGQEIQEKRDALRQEIKQRQQTLRQGFQQKLEALRQEIEKRRKQFREDAQIRKEELKKKLGEKRAMRIEQFFNKMIEKFEATIKRLNSFADRISARLDVASGRGKDVTAVRDQLLRAREKIAEAEKDLEDAKTKYTQAAKNPDFKAAFQEVRQVVNGLKAKLKEAHALLVEVVNSLKGLEEGPSGGGLEKESKGQEETRLVEITAAGFAPATLKIKIGTTVRFVNRDENPHWPASDVHPTHQICPGFDALKGLVKGESYSFTFKEAKKCPMHDHLNPSLKGEIIVE